MTQGTTQECRRCKVIKDLDEFHIDRTKPSGRVIYCRKCASEYKVELKYRPKKEKPLVKTCKFCGVLLDESNLKKNGKYYQAGCIKCETIQSQKWKDKNQILNRWYSFKSQYKNVVATKEEFISVVLSSDVCEICGGVDKRLVVDHCHKTGKLRGVLCLRCNFALGYFSDDVSLMEKSIEYLKRGTI